MALQSYDRSGWFADRIVYLVGARDHCGVRRQVAPVKGSRAQMNPAFIEEVDRFYNNLFVQHGNLSPYDAARLPVWMEGNVFLQEAKASRHEKLPLGKPDFDPAMRLLGRAGSFSLEITLDKAWGAEQTRKSLPAWVSAPRPAVVVASQTYYHAWHAYVDGKRVPLWRANYAFQSLQVPAGLHLVRLVYEDGLFQCGAAASLASLLICLFACSRSLQVRYRLRYEQSICRALAGDGIVSAHGLADLALQSALRRQ